ncbi:hypothetical protein CEXT_739231 [Caerostris extrusa]|uniref:Uncharacterized protein n=1 Tax=Caerostris extrusa TaxID=172846 RepID=A0AAV4YCY4_CAEEX|nr:hypothetical protein CEXT_739231 [Caerostris extrusa]
MYSDSSNPNYARIPIRDCLFAEHSTTKQSSPNSLTCAELLVIGAAQTTVLAGFENVQQFALQSFCTNADRGKCPLQKVPRIEYRVDPSHRV